MTAARALARLLTLATLMLLVGPMGALGCATLGTARDDVQQASALHHIDLRWGRLENAAMRVAPDARGAFLADWAKAAGAVEVQDIDVGGIVVDEGGEAADVVVTITYVERDTMSVKSAVVSERWRRIDGVWLCATPVTVPGVPGIPHEGPG